MAHRSAEDELRMWQHPDIAVKVRNTQRRWPDKLHPSHVTRVSIDASSYDEICIHCGATDISGGGWGKLREPCPGKEGVR